MYQKFDIKFTNEELEVLKFQRKDKYMIMDNEVFIIIGADKDYVYCNKIDNEYAKYLKLLS